MLRLEVYRLMQFTLRDVLERRYGEELVDSHFYEAGYLAGHHYYEHLIGPVADLQEFVRRAGQSLLDFGIGILAVEEADVVSGKFVITVSEDVDCSGLPRQNSPICTYDEGFISALLESFSGCKYIVREVDCWTTGARTCRFVACLSGD
jgi:predicted hydrocarbon binding protein